MAITTAVSKLVKEFEAENPSAKGKARLTSGNRSADEQLRILLQPKRKKNYLNIKKRFLKFFELKELPTYDALEEEQRQWWLKEIGKQAGKPNGFAHVGGNAQDVSVKTLDTPMKTKLLDKLQTKFGVLPEQVSGSSSKYGVPIGQANVFHVYKGGPTKPEPKKDEEGSGSKARKPGEILDTVGRQAANDPADVQVVQELLSRIELPPLRPVRVTGRMDAQTLAAIEHFQSVHVGMNRPDGRVDPKGKTIQQLRRSR